MLLAAGQLAIGQLVGTDSVRLGAAPFTPIGPDTAAFRAVVDLQPLAIRHDEIDGSTGRAFHDQPPLV